MPAPPPLPRPVRVALFIDGQNQYHRCRAHFGWPWIHPIRLGEALVEQDRARHGPDSHVLAVVRYYTGLHDPNRNAVAHAATTRRLDAYQRQGVHTEAVPLLYDRTGRAREKGVDTRMALDIVRLGAKGLYDVAIIASEDSDLDPAAVDVYRLRDEERWIAVENALPWSPRSNTRWLPSVRRHRRIDAEHFDRVRDDAHH